MARPKTNAPLAPPDEIEAQFYEAMQRGDLDRLMQVWSDDEEISCVHPSGPRVIGAAAIRATFEAIFANGPIPAHPQKVRRLQTHACAVHNVLEHIQVPGPEGLQSGWVVATNVYVKTAQGWRLVSHHASPGSALEVQEAVAPASLLH